MTNSVTDEEFNQAIRNQDNKNIINHVCNQYRSILSDDVLRWCGLIGLWQCLIKHNDNFGVKFTTSLYRFVDWQCKGQINVELSMVSTEDIPDIPEESLSLIDRLILHEYLDKLPGKYRKLIHARFFENKSCAEIARESNCSRENIRQKLKRAINALKNMYLD